MVTSVAFGVVFGIARLSQYRVIRWFGTVVVEFFRAVPVLIMMIFFWLFLGKYSGISAGSAALHRRGGWSDPVQRLGDC